MGQVIDSQSDDLSEQQVIVNLLIFIKCRNAGYKEVRPDGVDDRSYGIVVFVIILLMLTLLVSVSTTMQGGLMQPPEQPIWLQPYLGRAFARDQVMQIRV
jgi:hypothetical protein